jgi:4-diphosphocytidyl-2-C-methyl-D-erythritol kinase
MRVPRPTRPREAHPAVDHARPVVSLARAKINLHLGVGPRRPDGFHDVSTVLVTLDLADVLFTEYARLLRVETMPELDMPESSNLAYRAAEVFGLAMGRPPRVRVMIEKRIPAAAGLGGGSADAAAVLRALAVSWGLHVEDPELLDVAAIIGADVPFLLQGGCALFEGRGDVASRRLPLPDLQVVLIDPGVPVPTASAYAAFDGIPAREPRSPEALIAAIEVNDAAGIAAALHNDLTAASIGLVPAIGDALAWLAGRPGVLGCEMAGSGSTVFGICAAASDAQAVAEEARERGWWAEACRTSEDEKSAPVPGA